MSPLHRRPEDPVRRLPWRVRLAWRRTADGIVADHVAGVLSQLGELRGLPVHGLAPTPPGTVRLVLPGWTVTLAGVAASSRAALSGAVQASQCRLSASGKYGRFWWVAVSPGPTRDLYRTVVLGSHLVVGAIEDGHRRLREPADAPLLMVS